MECPHVSSSRPLPRFDLTTIHFPPFVFNFSTNHYTAATNFCSPSFELPPSREIISNIKSLQSCQIPATNKVLQYHRQASSPTIEKTMASVAATITMPDPTISTLPPSSMTAMVCHPKWDEYDLRNYPPLPPLYACMIAFGVVSFFFISYLGLALIFLKKNLLERLDDGPEEELAERLRVEMVRAGLRFENDLPYGV